MISIDDLEGEMDIEVKQGPARREGESDEELLARRCSQYPSWRDLARASPATATATTA